MTGRSLVSRQKPGQTDSIFGIIRAPCAGCRGNIEEYNNCEIKVSEDESVLSYFSFKKRKMEKKRKQLSIYKCNDEMLLK